jgi:hypothetical protein
MSDSPHHVSSANLACTDSLYRLTASLLHHPGESLHKFLIMMQATTLEWKRIRLVSSRP